MTLHDSLNVFLPLYKNLCSLGQLKLENYWSEHFYPQKSLISYGFLKKISQLNFDLLGSKSKLDHFKLLDWVHNCLNFVPLQSELVLLDPSRRKLCWP